MVRLVRTDFNTKERADSYARFKNAFYDLEESKFNSCKIWSALSLRAHLPKIVCGSFIISVSSEDLISRIYCYSALI